MAGTKEGGKLAKQTNLMRYGENFYKRIGHAGGTAYHKTPRGFAAMPKEKVSLAGTKGGRISRRRPRISNNLAK